MWAGLALIHQVSAPKLAESLLGTLHSEAMKRFLVSLGLACSWWVAGCGDDPPNVGATCTSTTGCDKDLTCNTTVPGGYCTTTCTARGEQAECPDESICDTVAGGGTSCVKTCGSASDCRADQECNGVSGSNVKACKPKA